MTRSDWDSYHAYLFKALRDGGRANLREENIFIENILPQTMAGQIANDEWRPAAVRQRGVKTEGPCWGGRSLPIDSEPAEVAKFVIAELIRQWPKQAEVTVPAKTSCSRTA